MRRELSSGKSSTNLQPALTVPTNCRLLIDLFGKHIWDTFPGEIGSARMRALTLESIRDVRVNITIFLLLYNST